MIYAINYANEKYKEAQKLNSFSLKKIGKADIVYAFSPDDIDHDFRSKYSDILSQKKGNGFWLWKPYFVNRVFKKMKDGDYLFYLDSAALCLKNLKILREYMENNEKDILCFETPFLEINWTKDTVYRKFRGKNDSMFQIEATYFMLKKTEQTNCLVESWLELAKIKEYIDNSNTYLPCIEHRNDQSLLSLVCRNTGIEPICSISDRYFYYTISKYYNCYYLKNTAKYYADLYYKKHETDRLGWIIFCHHFGDSGFRLYFNILKKYVKSQWLYLKSLKYLQ